MSCSPGLHMPFGEAAGGRAGMAQVLTGVSGLDACGCWVSGLREQRLGVQREPGAPPAPGSRRAGCVRSWPAGPQCSPAGLGAPSEEQAWERLLKGRDACPQPPAPGKVAAARPPSQLGPFQCLQIRAVALAHVYSDSPECRFRGSGFMARPVGVKQEWGPRGGGGRAAPNSQMQLWLL